MNSKIALGKWGEMIAATFLESQGYSVIGKNVRTKYGEIDLIALHKEQVDIERNEATLVFVEVKARTSSLFGYPETSVTARKQKTLLFSIQSYLQEHLEHENNWRIDVIAIQKRPGSQKPEIIHFINAITNDNEILGDNEAN